MPFDQWIRQPHTVAFLIIIALICIAEIAAMVWLVRNPGPRQRRPLTPEERERFFAGIQSHRPIQYRNDPRD